MEFGVNVDPGHWPDDPAQAMRLLKRTGATWTRTVLMGDNASIVQTYFEACIANNIAELGVVGRESYYFSEHPKEIEFKNRLGLLTDLYKDQVDIWQIGNQPDNPAPDSWTQDEDTTDMMLRVANDVIPAEQGLICAPALVTGQPYTIDTLKVSYTAKNIYTTARKYKGETFPAFDNTGFLVTEYPSNIPSLGDKIVKLGQAEIVFVFCLSDKMYPGLGLFDVNDKPTSSFRAFKKMVEANS